jgi:hypothetical protein
MSLPKFSNSTHLIPSDTIINILNSSFNVVFFGDKLLSFCCLF